MNASEVEVKARNMGWLPKEQFKGQADKWIPAETFVERGETFVPYLKANNRKLEGKLNEAVGEIHSLKDMLKSNQEQIDALLAYNSEFNKQRVAEQRKGIVAGIKEAREAGDVETEEQLREQLGATRAALAKAEVKPAAREEIKPNIQPSEAVKAAFEGFRETHTWYDEDPDMRSVLIGKMQTKMLDPEFKKLSPAEQFEAAAQEVESRFGMNSARAKSKYEGGGGGQGPGSVVTKGKGYAELPEEAKAGCERYAAKLVGPKKTYKTETEWQQKFAEDYWRNNPNG